MLERDDQRRALLAETESDAKVKRVRSTLRFSYEEPTAIRWVQEKGETKSLTGSWTFEDLGEGHTRATYALEADPGRMLGCRWPGRGEGARLPARRRRRGPEAEGGVLRWRPTRA